MPPSPARRAAIPSLLCLLVLALLFLTVEILTRRDRLGSSPAATVALLARGLSIAAGGAALTLCVRRRGVLRAAAPDVDPAFLGRLLVHAGLLAFVATSVLYPLLAEELSAVRSVFLSAFLLGLAALAGAPALRGTLPAPAGFGRLADVAAMNAALLLVLLEAAAGLTARFLPSEILWDAGSAASRIEAFKHEPGSLLMGSRVNRSGFHDDDFFAAGERDLVVAVLADSFGQGAIPREHNFIDIAERIVTTELAGRFERVALHNLGVPAIGMSEYLWLLENEAEPLRPALVVLCVYVGNDIGGLKQVPRRYYCLQTLRIYELGARLLAVGRELRAGGRVFETELPAPGAAEAPKIYGQVPPMSEAAFVAYATEHLEVFRAGAPATERRYRDFFEALDLFARRAGERLLVLIIPDELQVDDSLWARLAGGAADPSAFHRELPQERIAAFCGQRGIDFVDVLAAEREGQRTGNVYLFRDTHWNEKGNRIGGEALAARILARAAGSNRPAGSP
jgi:hypothetical protein